MKTKAIIRIIACSLLFCILSSILCGGLILARFLSGKPSGKTTTIERKLECEPYDHIKIDWAAGSILITTGVNNDNIVIQETKDSNNHCTMSIEYEDDTIKIGYGTPDFGFLSHSAKDLVILVPYHWKCSELEINGAALKIDIENLSVDNLDLTGGANELNFTGKFLHELDAEGTGLKLNLAPKKGPQRINVEGVGTNLDLTLPGDLGFDVTLEGIGTDFSSHVAYSKNGNRYRYAGEECKIEVSGLGCKVSVDPS